MGLTQRLHRIRYFFADAWDEWRHSPSLNALALATLVAALFVAGLVMLLVTNIGHRVLALRDDAKVEIYLRDDQSATARDELLARLRARDHVERVEYVDKDQALARYREWAAESAALVNELETNPLPASFEVYLASDAAVVETASAIAKDCEGDLGVEEVRVNRDWLGRLESLLALARGGGGTIAALVSVAVVFVMGSVLRLAVHARRDEIEIMRLVGATPAFIRGPYLVAGGAQGAVAGLLALGLVELARVAAVSWTEPAAAPLVGLLAARTLSLGTSASLLALGIVVGLAGAWISVRAER